MIDQKYIDRFWSKVDKNAANGCWEWLDKLDPNGYGRTYLVEDGKKKWYFAHRLSLKLNNVNIDNLVACHHCDNPKCVNPEHLFLGTQADNMRDMKDKGRHNWDNWLKAKSIQTPLGVFPSIRAASIAHNISRYKIERLLIANPKEYILL